MDELRAYYYSFAPTGQRVVDLILHAVARAGKAFHHTSQWTEDEMAEFYEHCEGDTCVEWIQNAANKAAAELAALRAELAVLRNNQLGPVPEGPLKALGAWVADHTDDDTWPNAERYLNAALAEMEALRERDADRKREYGYSQETVNALTSERDALLARAEKAEDALLRKGYRMSCDIPGCNCGDQWTHGGYAEMRITEIREALEQANARRNGQTILADLVHALACRERAEAALRQIGKHPESCGDDCVSELARQDALAELAAARGRYEWLADKVLAPDYGDNDKGCVGWNIKHCKGPAWIAGDSIDKAIDAARKGEAT